MILQLWTRVNDIYTDWRGTLDSGGFFYYLNYYATEHEIEIPFLSNIQAMDLVYHGNFSGNKIVSSLIDNWYTEDFFPAQAVKLAEMFWKIEGERLLRLWSTYNKQYDPLWNYNMSGLTTEGHTGSDTLEKLGTQADTTSGKVQNTKKIEGLDSSTFQDSERTETEYGTSNTDRLKVERSFNNRQDQTTYNSTLTTAWSKQGNIGVKTNQEMLREEIEVWTWNFYYKVLFPAVDKILTIPVY